jgi:hypothetical protein
MPHFLFPNFLGDFIYIGGSALGIVVVVIIGVLLLRK